MARQVSIATLTGGKSMRVGRLTLVVMCLMAIGLGLPETAWAGEVTHVSICHIKDTDAYLECYGWVTGPDADAGPQQSLDPPTYVEIIPLYLLDTLDIRGYGNATGVPGKTCVVQRMRSSDESHNLVCVYLGPDGQPPIYQNNPGPPYIFVPRPGGRTYLFDGPFDVISREPSVTQGSNDCILVPNGFDNQYVTVCGPFPQSTNYSDYPGLAYYSINTPGGFTYLLVPGQQERVLESSTPDVDKESDYVCVYFGTGFDHPRSYICTAPSTL